MLEALRQSRNFTGRHVNVHGVWCRECGFPLVRERATAPGDSTDVWRGLTRSKADGFGNVLRVRPGGVNGQYGNWPRYWKDFIMVWSGLGSVACLVFAVGFLVFPASGLVSVPVYFLMAAPVISYLGFELKLYSDGLHLRYALEGPASATSLRGQIEAMAGAYEGKSPAVLFIPVTYWGPILAVLGLYMGANTGF